MPRRAASARTTLRLPSRRPPLRRLMWTLAQLRAGQKLTAEDVARRFEVGLRTAYRDFDFLREMAPIDYDRAANSWRLTEPTAALETLTLSQGELVALFFAEKVLQQYQHTPYESDLVAAFRKIQALLPEQVKVRPDHLESYLSLDLGPLPEGDAAIFRDVAASLGQRRSVTIRSRSLSSDTLLDRKVDPYQLFNLKGGWYLAAWDHKRAAVRDFALHRIRRVTATGEAFTVQAGFSFKKYGADAFAIEKGGRLANVSIRFAARQALWIRERRWHRSQRIQERLDGGCVLRMRVKLTSELRRWVLQFGEEAEVLAPKGWRNEVASSLLRASSLYGLARLPAAARGAR